MTVLVVSGGGLWSLAAIGAAEALRDMGVVVDGYVGSSAGAMVGAFLAMGYPPQMLREMALTVTPKDFGVAWRHVWRTLARGRLPVGLIQDTRLWGRLAPAVGHRQWRSMPQPLWVVATSLTRRRPVVFGPGEPVSPEFGHRMHLAWGGEALEVGPAIKASMAVPGLFAPVRLGEDWLVDGGVLDDYPLDVAAWVGADHIIGVWVDEEAVWQPPTRWHGGHVAVGSVTTMIRELTVLRQRQVVVPGVTIRLQMDGGHRVFERIGHIIQQGYLATIAQAPAIEALGDQRA